MLLLPTPPGVEVTQRVKDGQAYTFVLNHGDGLARLQLGDRALTDLLSGNVASGMVELPAKGVMILRAAT